MNKISLFNYRSLTQDTEYNYSCEDKELNELQQKTSYGGFYTPSRVDNKINTFASTFLKKSILRSLSFALLAAPLYLALSVKVLYQTILSSNHPIKLFNNVFIGIFPSSEKIRKFAVCGDSQSLVCKDSKESFKWKKKLIQAAKSNIVLSGNFCGGTAFDETLDLMESKLKQGVKIVIISSPLFFTKNNRKKIQMLKKSYPDLFTLIPTDIAWNISPKLKVINNHVKGLSIDNGAYFLTGGSGIENKYTDRKGVGDKQEEEHLDNSDNFFDRFLPKAFRDMDFVFKSCPSSSLKDKKDTIVVGGHFHSELLKLANLWVSSYNKNIKNQEKQRNNVKKILKEYEKNPKQGDVLIQDFDSSQRTNKKCFTQIFTTSPEHECNPFLESMIERINSAKERIFINHMYFHPGSELFKALVNAANRGVKITLITNDSQKFSPKTHVFFGNTNKYYIQRFFQSIQKKYQKNIQAFAYGQKYAHSPRETTLHSKAIVVDNYVIAGSSNLGYKSLDSMSDYELNFITESEEMANATVKIFEKNIFSVRKVKDKENRYQKVPLSRKITNPGRKLPLKKRIISYISQILAPIIG